MGNPLFIEHVHYDKGLEQSVLGICLLEPNTFGKIQGLVNASCFYVTGHAAVYTAIADMWRNNLPINIFTVINYAARSKDPTLLSIQPTPAYFVTELTKSVVSSAGVEYSSLQLRTMYCERELMKIRSTPDKSGGDVLTKIAKLQKELEDLVSIKVSYDWSDMTEITMMLMNHMASVKDKELMGLTTGFHDVDLMTGGLTESTVTVIGARPSVGKSALLNTMAIEQACMGNPVGIISLETPKVQLGARMAAQISNTDFYKIFRNRLYDEKERAEVHKYLSAMAELPIYISDKVGINVDDIKSKAAQLIYKKNITGLYIDYLQLVESTDDSQKKYNREQEVSKISRACKIIAMDFGIPLVLLSQLSRETEKSNDKKPQLHHLRESGAIEQDADNVVFLHRDWKVGITQNEHGNSTEREADYIVAKWRNGELGQFKIGFDPPKMRFFDPSRENQLFSEKPWLTRSTGGYVPISED